MDAGGDVEVCSICTEAFDGLESTPCCGGKICGQCVRRTCEEARQQFKCPYCSSRDDAFFDFAARVGSDLEKTRLKQTWSLDLAVAPEALSCALGRACACPRGPIFDSSSLMSTRHAVAWPMLVCESCGQSAVHELCHGGESYVCAPCLGEADPPARAEPSRQSAASRLARAPRGVDYALSLIHI